MLKLTEQDMLPFSAGYRTIFFHAACWLLFISYEQLSVMVVAKTYEPAFGMLYFYLVNISVFYLQTAILKRFFAGETPRYGRGALFMLVTLLAVMLVKMFGEIVFNHEDLDLIHLAGDARVTVTLDLLRSIFYMVLGTTYWMIGFNIRLRKKTADEQIRQLRMAGINADLQVKLAGARNAYLQQQINPHLLFNTLNFVYSTVHKHSPQGGRAVFLLTEILDFSLRKTDENGRSALSDEVNQLGHLVELNRYRFDFELELVMMVNGDLSAQRIIPLVLLTLVENMFVHGDFKNKAARISLKVSAGGVLDFATENFFSRRSHLTGRGSGLQNIRTRLEYSYPGRFQLQFEESGQQFFTHLTIQL